MKLRLRRRLLGVMLAAAIMWLASCSTPAAPTSAPPDVFEPSATEGPLAEPTWAAEPLPTQASGVVTQLPTLPGPSATPVIEARVVELEWPGRLRLGDSDSVRLALLPSANGYTASAEFPDHTVQTTEIPIHRPGGYDLLAAATLDGIQFDLSPYEEQVLPLQPGEPVTWHWTVAARQPGSHRLTLRLVLRWVPAQMGALPTREALVYSRGMDVQVASFLGMTARQTASAGMVAFGLGGGLALLALLTPLRGAAPRLKQARADRRVALETPPAIDLDPTDATLLRATFHGYGRLLVDQEFRSGYSGARTFLVRPLRPDGRADAATIVKLGEASAIRAEVANYQHFVQDSLPPLTARIQHAPVSLAGKEARCQAAIRYTFIGQPGQPPRSLRQALLEQPDPALLRSLLNTFGPGWWLQRRPWTFRCAEEYDRLLPAHLFVAPAQQGDRVLDGGMAPGAVQVRSGDFVRLDHFERFEPRADGRSLAIIGRAQPGQVPLRLRAEGLDWRNGAAAQVHLDRTGFLRERMELHPADFDRLNLPDPLACLPVALDETISGTRSIIHGDLNLENVLVGPSGLVWLIDFAQTREGHPLFDFAHLAAEITAHVLPEQIASVVDFAAQFAAGQIPLLAELDRLAQVCLFNPAVPREWHLANCLACLGALKYPQLDRRSRQFLGVAAAVLAQRLA